MKHLLNNLSEEEKNSIREQHTGGMQVNNSRFNSLLENRLGNSKPLINEDKIEDFEDEDTLNEQTKEDVDNGKKTGCYTVKRGDTVLAIANKFGITLDDIKALNGMTSGNKISPGQKLRVKNTTKFVGC